jgi:hypothetical protein
MEIVEREVAEENSTVRLCPRQDANSLRQTVIEIVGNEWKVQWYTFLKLLISLTSDFFYTLKLFHTETLNYYAHTTSTNYRVGHTLTLRYPTQTTSRGTALLLLKVLQQKPLKIYVISGRTGKHLQKKKVQLWQTTPRRHIGGTEV